jgi:hypothetical protein
MASTLPKQPDPTGQIRPRKVLTAGFNSPVPECTLQVSSHFTKTRRQEFATEHQVKQSSPLAQRSWFDRLLEIF